LAIRSVYGAYESVEGTAAAAGTLGVNYNFLRVVKFTPTKPSKLDNPRETTNSTITTQHPRPSTRQFNFTVQVRAYYDMTMFWDGMAYGAGTTAGHPSATGAFDTTFLTGGTAPLSATLKWKQVGSQGTIWWQATGCKVKQSKISYMSNIGLVREYQGFGRYPTSISTPTVPADTTAAYNQPMSMDQQAVTKNSSPWLKVKKFDVTTDNGMAPDWVVNNVRDLARLKLGDSTTKADVQAFFDAYAGSLAEYHDSATSKITGGVILSVIDAATAIGTGTPTHPGFVVSIPQPYVDDTSDDDTPTDPEEKSTILAGYDGTLAADISLVYTNEIVAATFFAGH
jgi:hypothetical protein